jgi:hypothetical protein
VQNHFFCWSAKKFFKLQGYQNNLMINHIKSSFAAEFTKFELIWAAGCLLYCKQKVMDEKMC